MCMNGAGIGMGLIQAVRRLTLEARSLALDVCYAAGLLTIMTGTPVRPDGTVPVRATVALLSASGWRDSKQN